MFEWLAGNWRDILAVPLSLLVLYAVVIAAHRLVGLRSFSKMAGSDFVTTVAIGSLLGTAIATPDPSIVMAGTGLLSLFVVVLVSAWLRRHGPVDILDNRPVYLMDGPRVLSENLDRVNVTLDDLHTKLREANVWSYRQVIAVVFERTGDVSVISRPGGDLAVDAAIFRHVAGAPGPAADEDG